MGEGDMCESSSSHGESSDSKLSWSSELTDDATSSSPRSSSTASQPDSNGSLFDLSSLMAQLPIKWAPTSPVHLRLSMLEIDQLFSSVFYHQNFPFWKLVAAIFIFYFFAHYIAWLLMKVKSLKPAEEGSPNAIRGSPSHFDPYQMLDA